jgi:uncharacterized membrane protein YccC
MPCTCDHRPKPRVTIHIRHLYLDVGLRPFHVRQLDTIVEALSTILTRLQTMSAQTDAAFADLDSKLSALTTVGDGLATLLNTIHAALVEALKGTDATVIPAVQAIADKIPAKIEAWNAAIIANTEADPSV